MTTKLMLLCFFLLLACRLASQQNLEVKSVSNVEMTTFLSFDNDNKKEGDAVVVQPKGEGVNLIEHPVFEVLSGDLAISFDIPVEKTGFYSIQLNNIENVSLGRTIPILPERLYGDIGEKIPAGESSRKTIRVANAADNANPLYLSGEVKMEIAIVYYDYRTVYGNFFGVRVKCDDTPPAPIKGLKFKRGHGLTLIGGVLTVASYGSGILLKESAEDIYLNKYKKNHIRRTSAEGDYLRANKKYNNSVKLKTAGIALGAATLTWVLVQQLIQRERKNTYKCKCQNNCKPGKEADKRQTLELFTPPLIEGSGSLSGYMGMGIRFNF